MERGVMHAWHVRSPPSAAGASSSLIVCFCEAWNFPCLYHECMRRYSTNKVQFIIWWWCFQWIWGQKLHKRRVYLQLKTSWFLVNVCFYVEEECFWSLHYLFPPWLRAVSSPDGSYLKRHAGLWSGQEINGTISCINWDVLGDFCI